MGSKIVSDSVQSEKPQVDHRIDVPASADDPHDAHSEKVPQREDDLVYNNAEEEPELHARTWLAVASVVLVYFVGVIALQAPPAVLSYIGQDLNNTAAETWVPNCLSIVQGVLGPIFASISDTFQVRKTLIVGCCVIAFIGAAIAPGSKTIYRLIAAQTLIGFAFAAVPLVFSVPSEILPRKWRPMAQGVVNATSSVGATIGPIIIGALIKKDRINGWRTFYWIQMGLWGTSALGIFVAYRPPKPHTRYDHLSFWHKIAQLDIVGSFLLTLGLTLLLTGLNLGGGLYSWTNARTLTTLTIGIVGLIAFILYEWLATETGILHHDFFRGGKRTGRTFAICLGLIAVEGIMLFAFVIFYPILNQSLFESDPLLLTVREIPYWMGAAISSVVFGYVSTKFRTIREAMAAGFAIWTVSFIGLATVQPGQSTKAIIFAAVSGIGFGVPLILVVAGVQLTPPPLLIATATAVSLSSRAVGATVFTAVFSAIFDRRLAQRLPSYVGEAAAAAGLPTTSLHAFVGALTTGETAAIAAIPGVTPAIIAAGVAAMKQAFADSIRPTFIITAAIGAAAFIASLFLGDVRKTMNYCVDAPVEELHAKGHRPLQQGPETGQ